MYKERRHKFLRVQGGPLQVSSCADKSVTVLMCAENPPQGLTCTKMFPTVIMYAEKSATAHCMLAGCTTPPLCMLGRTTLPCCVLGRLKQVAHLRALPYKFYAETHYFTMVCARTYYSSPCYDEMSVQVLSVQRRPLQVLVVLGCASSLTICYYTDCKPLVEPIYSTRPAEGKTIGNVVQSMKDCLSKVEVQEYRCSQRRGEERRELSGGRLSIPVSTGFP